MLLIHFIVENKVTVATQTGHDSPDFSFNPDKMTVDKHCYECKVRYRDPKPQDLVMYLHAWKYQVSDTSQRKNVEWQFQIVYLKGKSLTVKLSLR